jgi:hippurate hydrolase
VRQTIIKGVERTARGIAIAAGVPEDRMPVVTVIEDESTPPTVNNLALSARLEKIFATTLGAAKVIEQSPIMGSEDFGVYSLDGEIPSVIFWLGAYDPAKVAESRKMGIALPYLHSPLFAPMPEPTLRTGITVMTDAALHLLN